jgi:hypothetical protein
MQGYGDGRGREDRVISPAARYAHPQAVLDDPALTLQQKRSILSQWASDFCAVDSDPTLRRAPGSLRAVKVGDIFAALAALDGGSPPRGGGAARRPSLPDAIVPRMPAMAGAVA